MTATVFFAGRSGPDWQAQIREIARSDAVCGVVLRARLYMEVQF